MTHRSLAALLLALGLAAFSGAASAGEGPTPLATGWYRPPVEFDSIRYIVITGRKFIDAWKPFVQWKTKKGVAADVVAVEDVLNNSLYRGTDGPETLRNFIADLYWKWGLDWVLLGGDVNVVPTRMCPTYAGHQASDLYYSALDGSWNSNCDGEYGSTEDRTDLVEEVFVGRVPIESDEEIRGWLKKFFLYIRPEHRDYQTRALLVGAILGSDAMWDADDHYKEIKEEAFVPAGFEVTELEESERLRGDLEEHKTKKGQLYESGYVFGKSNERAGPSDLKHFLKYVNRGTGVISHIIHSNVYLMGLGKGWITRDAVLKLKNEKRPTVVYSSGCQVNMFNLESISEHVLLYPKGGAVAFIGCTVNSYAHQNKFERDFWEALFFHDIHRIGRTLAASKARRNHLTTNPTSDPITIINRGVNLLGDPEMSIWTRTPSDLDVEAPASAALGQDEIAVKVTASGKPRRDALVCLWKEGEVHATAVTGADGSVKLPVRCRFPGKAYLTVTAHNAMPWEGEVEVGAGAESAKVTLADLAVSDGAEGYLDAGEKATVPLALCLQGATARVVSAEGKVRVVQSKAEFPTVPAKGAAVSKKSVVLQAASDAPPGHRAVLKVELSDGSGKTWTEAIPVYVNASWVVRLGQHFLDKASDGDGRLTFDDAGNTVDMDLEVGNLGSGCARGVQATLRITGEGIRVKNSTVVVGDVPVGARIRLPEPFHLELDESFGGPPLECRLEFTSKTGTLRTEEFFIEEPLDPPEGMSTRGRRTAIDLRWSPVENERITGYNVYRADSAGGTFKRVNPTLVTASCFEDGGLPRTTPFWYRVTALDRSLNESSPSEPVQGRTIYGQQRDWPKKTNGRVTHLTLADLDGDGDPEIGTGDNMGPWIWHHTGQEVHHGGDYWTFGLFARIRGGIRAPTFADVDGAGSMEVIVVTHEGGQPVMEIVDGQMHIRPGSDAKAKINVYDLNGKPVKGWPQSVGKATRFPVQVADLDNDGKVELLLVRNDGEIRVFKADGSKFGSGKFGKKGEDPRGLPALVDLDGDGDLEIAGLGGEGKLYAYHHDGSSAGLSFDAKSGRSDMAAGDLDGDGKPELVFCGDEGKKLHVLKGDSTALPGFPASIDAGKGSLHPAVADLDGDGIPELLVAGGKKVFAVRKDGSVLPGFPAKCRESCLGLAVADVEGDGKANLIVAVKNGIHGF
ncbi:MAG: C25 family cysteine peptidase, partial [Planctomycetota bacterium]